MAKMDEINEQTTMGEITSQFQGARRALFARYHIGGCSSCSYKDAETLQEVCTRNSISSEEVINHILNSHAEDKKMLIEPLVAKELLDSGAEVRFVDMRTREEHEAVAIPDSYFMTQELQQEIFGSWDRSDELTIILYDHTGKSSIDTCAWFLGHEMKTLSHSWEGSMPGVNRWISRSLVTDWKCESLFLHRSMRIKISEVNWCCQFLSKNIIFRMMSPS